MPLLNCNAPQWVDGDGDGGGGGGAAGGVPARAGAGQVACEVGVVHGATGSALVTLADDAASVLCSVHGPATAQRGVVEGVGILEVSIHYAPFAERPSAADTQSLSSEGGGGGNQMSTFEKFMSQMTKDALERSVRLELYPKMVISLSLVVLKSSGNTGTDLAAVITSGSLALVHARIETLDFVTACAMGVSADGNVSAPLVSNPTSTKNGHVAGTLTLATLASLEEISQLYCEGKIDSQVMPHIMSAACRAAESLRIGIADFVKNL